MKVSQVKYSTSHIHQHDITAAEAGLDDIRNM